MIFDSRSKRSLLCAVLSAPLVLGACAHQDAKAKADQALSIANKALVTAQDASRKADQAAADAHAASEKADRMYDRSLKK